MDTTSHGRVRHNAIPAFGEGTDNPLQLNMRGEQIVANAMPLNAQLVSMGGSYQASTTTAAAPVIAVPTTAALLGLWNGENDNGKSYVIDSIFAYVVANTAAVQSMGLLANVSIQPVLTALANTIAPRALRANRPYVGAARVAVGITLDAASGVASNWFPMGQSVANSNTPQIGQIIEVPVNGLIILPPKGQLALTVLAGAATASSVQLGVRWHEMQLPAAI